MLKRLPIIVIFLLLTSCETLSKREKEILNYSAGDTKNYENYLVSIKKYTTNGKIYHKKYYKYLIGLSRYISEKKKHSIVENSIGFYYDKRENIKTKLYLGVDLHIQIDVSMKYHSYSGIAKKILKKHLRNILHIIFSSKRIFAEKEVVGIVIGFHWEKGTAVKAVTIWIDKRDVILYEKDKLTLYEVIERNIITNTKGKVIRLAI